ncbi:MAG TPA: protein kinase [Kofleriaceae bacterium]|nr:protein kinase [Kofleriaceae bacterium]
MEKLGRYEIVRHWATGGMAQVLLARTTGIGGFERYVVVKRIQSEHAKDERFVRMFLDEARLAAMLHHGNIVQVHEVGDEGGRIFFAMEYVHGEDLRRLLRNLNLARQKTPLEHVVAIVSAAADALHHAHEQRGSDGKPLGLVHRDVTPANIIVGYDGIVKVVDFGIAKAALRSTETAGGTLKGKVAYMSPEQCMGKPVDRRSDVYGLGVVLYEASCVRRLFKGDNDFLTMSSIIAGKIPPPTRFRPYLPKELEQIILKALAIRPEDRFQTAAEMGAALEQFAVSAGLRPSPKALAAFLKQRFGTRPEPWLVEGEPEQPLTADFDGSENGLVTPPLQALENLSIPQEAESSPSAPIVRARNKAVPHKPSYLPPPRAKSQPRAAARPVTPPPAADEAQPSIVLGPDLAGAPGVTTGAEVDHGWGASDKEATPSLMQVAFAAGSSSVEVDPRSGAPVPPASAPKRTLPPWLASARQWFRTTLPAWARRTLPVWMRSRRAQLAAAGAVLVLLVIVVGATRSSTRSSSAAPALQTPPPKTAQPADPAPAKATTQGDENPATQPPDTTKNTPARPRPTSTPVKKKRPKPKFIF